MQGWIKLHRQLREHEIMRDPTALQIFVWILISVDYKTGKMISGRFWGSKELNINPNTFYKALRQRVCKKYDLVTLSSNNKNTTISVNNWKKYQEISNSVGNNEVTTGQQQSNTKQEYKEEKNIYTSNESKIFSYFSFKEKIEENEMVVQIAKEFDIRPKDVIWCVRDMLSKSSDKEIKIKNVKAKLNTWINNAIRWHSVATLTSKEEAKPKPKFTEDQQLAMLAIKKKEELLKNAKKTIS